MSAQAMLSSAPRFSEKQQEKRSVGRVGRWRGGLGGAYLLPTLSVAGASVSPPCSVSTLPLIEPDVRISRIRLSDWLHSSAHNTLP